MPKSDFYVELERLALDPSREVRQAMRFLEDVCGMEFLIDFGIDNAIAMARKRGWELEQPAGDIPMEKPDAEI